MRSVRLLSSLSRGAASGRLGGGGLQNPSIRAFGVTNGAGGDEDRGSPPSDQPPAGTVSSGGRQRLQQPLAPSTRLRVFGPQARAVRHKSSLPQHDETEAEAQDAVDAAALEAAPRLDNNTSESVVDYTSDATKAGTPSPWAGETRLVCRRFCIATPSKPLISVCVPRQCSTPGARAM